MDNRTQTMRWNAKGVALVLASVLMTTPAAVQAGDTKAVPYWASLSASEARMRVGPSLDYPSNWVYRRRDLPVKVVQVHTNWRKIEDSTGTQGWMHVRLLSDAATAIVTQPIAEMHVAPDPQSKLLYRAEAGVVGRVKNCDRGWCHFDIQGQRGYIRANALWGAVQ